VDTTTERSAWSARSQELAQLMSRCALGDRVAFARLYDLSSATARWLKTCCKRCT
jgi:hypothetical protein